MEINSLHVEKFEQFLEPGEAFVLVTDCWNYENAPVLIGLSEEHFYLATYRFVSSGLWKKEYEIEFLGNMSLKYGSFGPKTFIDKNRSNTGKVISYSFLWDQIDGYSQGHLTARDISEAEIFKQAFEVRLERSRLMTDRTDFAEQISLMGQLFNDGVLTKDEFERAKELFLGKPVDVEQRAERTLRGLKQLRDSGVLSEAEFATKKWDVLTLDTRG